MIASLENSVPSVGDQPARDGPPYGLLIAGAIISTWAISLVLLIRWDISQANGVWLALAMLWQTFLYTGLFITAHDAMHEAVAPQCLPLNQAIGSLALTLYGLFSYEKLLQKHWQHHGQPASALDPDFHDGQHKSFLAWYLHFMQGYWSWRRLIGLMVVFNSLSYGFHVSETNLTLFWAIPSILSSVQLFYFGTFLPHREPATGYEDPFRAQSSYRPLLWSFLTCYHFGYHKEHHEYPHVAWWQLPTIAKQQMAAQIP